MDAAEKSSADASNKLPGRRRRAVVFAIFLFAFLLALASWAFSYQRVIDLSTSNAIGQPRLQLFLNRGLILIFFFPDPKESWPAHATMSVYPMPDTFDANYWARSRYGFSQVDARIPEHARPTASGRFIVERATPWVIRREWGVPYWSMTVATGLVTLLALRPIVRRRRWRRSGCCEACGYDLRGISDRCPECGRAITASRKGSAHTARAS